MYELNQAKICYLLAKSIWKCHRYVDSVWNGKVSEIKSKHGQRLGEKSIDNLQKKNSDTPETLLFSVTSHFICFDIETVTNT